MKKFLQVFVAALLGLLLGLGVVVISFIPGWEQPEGMSAGVVWGGIAYFTLVGTLPIGLVATAFAFFLNFQHRKRMIVLESVLLLVLALVILVLLNQPQH